VFASLNGVADDIDTAYSDTLFLGVKLLDPSVVRQLGLHRVVVSNPRLYPTPAESQTPSSSISISSSYPSSSGVESSESVYNSQIGSVHEENISSLKLSRHESASSKIFRELLYMMLTINRSIPLDLVLKMN
jgi:hypothetical protein